MRGKMETSTDSQDRKTERDKRDTRHRDTGPPTMAMGGSRRVFHGGRLPGHSAPLTNPDRVGGVGGDVGEGRDGRQGC